MLLSINIFMILNNGIPFEKLKSLIVERTAELIFEKFLIKYVSHSLISISRSS